jgi:hypothetical protein
MAKVPSTQEHLNIEEIRDDLVVVRNGIIALILETSALNFDLLSKEEQDVRIIGFANLLNGFNFPIQISIRTVRTDVSEYISKLENFKNRQISLPLAKQMEIYIQFIKNLTTKNEILDKRFFVTIPYKGGVIGEPSLIKRLVGGKPRVTNVDSLIEKAKIDLYPKRDNIVRLFKKMGLSARQLTNNELLLLFYEVYDPDKIGYQKIELSVKDYTTGVVEPLMDKPKTITKK